jgi:hypothetical protein
MRATWVAMTAKVVVPHSFLLTQFRTTTLTVWQSTFHSLLGLPRFGGSS